MRHANLNKVIRSSVSPVFRQVRCFQNSKCVKLKKSPKESILLKSNNHIYLITISLGLTCGKLTRNENEFIKYIMTFLFISSIFP